MADVRWIKIVTDIFDDEKILLIETMPEADTIIVIWFKLLCLAGKQNNSGVFTICNRMPYTDEMFAAIFRRPINTVRFALRTFEKYGMIEIINDTVTIPNWGKHQSLDQLESKKEYMRGYMQEYREKQKQKLISGDVHACKTNSKANVSEAEEDKEIDTEEETEKDKERKRGKRSSASASDLPTRHRYGKYKNVLLSDEDMEKLKSEFPEDWEKRIERLSEYIESKGAKYKNHLATIRSWARRETEKRNSQASGNGMYYMPNQPTEDDPDDFIKTYYPGGM